MGTAPGKEQRHATGEQGITWSECSAFEDAAELDHACEQFREQAKIAPSLRDRPEYLTGKKSFLIKRLNIQARKTEEILEAEKPGLYPRTWMAGLFWDLFSRLNELTDNPDDLSENVPWLCEALHKLLIAAHEVFDPRHRAALVAGALIEQEQKTAAAHKERSAKGGHGRKGKRAPMYHVLKALVTQEGKNDTKSICRALEAAATNKNTIDGVSIEGYKTENGVDTVTYKDKAGKVRTIGESGIERHLKTIRKEENSEP